MPYFTADNTDDVNPADLPVLNDAFEKAMAGYVLTDAAEWEIESLRDAVAQSVLEWWLDGRLTVAGSGKEA